MKHEYISWSLFYRLCGVLHERIECSALGLRARPHRGDHLRVLASRTTPAAENVVELKQSLAEPGLDVFAGTFIQVAPNVLKRVVDN